jgi:hypothetical protein
MSRPLATRAAAPAVAAALMLSATSAHALDAWRDRKGLFYGGGVGFGVGKTDVDTAENEVAINGRLRLGGGVNDMLTLDAELGLGNQIDVDTTLVTGMLGANVFVVEGMYLRAMGGMAHIGPKQGESSTGLGFGAGLGYEFFANSDLAVGVGADVQHHAFDNYGFNAFNFGVTFTMY